MNKIMLVGRLGQEPELRYTPSGVAVAHVSLATSERWKKDGKKKEITNWHRLVFWRKLAEIVGEYLGKGDLICIVGKVRTREYLSSGEKKWITEIHVDDLEMLGSRRNNNNVTPTPTETEEIPAEVAPLVEGDGGDDLPF